MFICVCVCVRLCIYIYIYIYIVGLLEQVSLPTFLKTKVTMQYQCVTVCKQKKEFYYCKLKRRSTWNLIQLRAAIHYGLNVNTINGYLK